MRNHILAFPVPSPTTQCLALSAGRQRALASAFHTHLTSRHSTKDPLLAFLPPQIPLTLQNNELFPTIDLTCLQPLQLLQSSAYLKCPIIHCYSQQFSFIVPSTL